VPGMREQLDELGYVVIRQLLSPDEVAAYRAEVQKVSGLGDADSGKQVFDCGDGVTQNPRFWPLIYHTKLVDVIRMLIGPAARYTQHSDIYVNMASQAAEPGGKRIGGWHRDSACREFNLGPDWDESREPHQIVRVAIYLQSYRESHSSLGVMPGSHRREQRLSGNDLRLWSRVLDMEYRGRRILWRLGMADEPIYYHPWFLQRNEPVRWQFLSRPTMPVWIKTEPGDCVIFDQRLYHSSSPIVGPKYSVFLSYSPENEHARNHIRYYRFFRKDLNYEPIPPELAEILKEHDLYMEVPEPSEFEGATMPAYS